MNRDHAKENDGVKKEAALALLANNSAAAAAAIRALNDAELDRAAPVSLNSDAPLTCQFMLEDHAVRHSYHHLAGIRAALAR
jgi:ribonuclease HI